MGRKTPRSRPPSHRERPGLYLPAAQGAYRQRGRMGRQTRHDSIAGRAPLDREWRRRAMEEGSHMMPARDGIRRAIVSAMVFAATVPALGQSYDNLVHSPDGFRGRKVLLTGKIIQSLQEGQVYTLRVNVTP